MASKEEIIAKAKASITEFDEDMAAEAANESLAAKIDPVEIIEHGYTAGMLEV